ncbi:FeoA family protein [Propionispora vibrioides]|uniref:Fe2+ transport system protein FeoA n=1 Tax=Propionispora vibrioides TaxID=112903 RepID=A0A1H8PZ03_9FIRM|nr:FeoA family protein [Propionispora vibrioides]SEO47170.1 Fe2+ transport system protein FeoA [Propionispora vibrioides]
MPLTMASPGQEVKVVDIRHCGDHRIRLLDMGLTTGALVRVISRNASSLLIGVKRTRIMLEFRLAHQIDVQ